MWNPPRSILSNKTSSRGSVWSLEQEEVLPAAGSMQSNSPLFTRIRSISWQPAATQLIKFTWCPFVSIKEGKQLSITQEDKTWCVNVFLGMLCKRNSTLNVNSQNIYLFKLQTSARFSQFWHWTTLSNWTIIDRKHNIEHFHDVEGPMWLFLLYIREH